MTREERAALGLLAAELGVQRAYTDAGGARRVASRAAFAAVCTALGWQVGEDGRGAQEALRALRADRSAGLAEPVHVAWDGRSAGVPLRVRTERRVEWSLQLEDGTHSAGAATPDRLAQGGEEVRLLPLSRLPVGVHLLALEHGGQRQEVHVLAAPRRARPVRAPAWGVFLPLYALPGRFGVGDLTELERLASWTGRRGGAMVGSTPIFATFLDKPYDPSPYAPVTRLFWNELYLDPTLAPEMQRSGAARTLLASPDYEATLARLRAEPLVDHGGAMAAKRRLLERLLDAVDGPRRAQLDQMRRDDPHLDAYASFRARCEAAGGGWPAWSEDDSPSERNADYHAYVQLLFREQLAQAGAGEALYLDMPLGVHPDGFDTWRFPDSFVDGLSVGAPPDELFSGGQDWGFRPLHPLRVRQNGHAYMRDSLRTLFGHAATVRIDHVMGLHRLYCVPLGMSARDGVYVRQPAEELYALLAIESHRHGTVVVGEDLGTVPTHIRRSMGRHGLLRSYVLQLEIRPGADPFDEVPRHALAGTNTHDMPTFTGFWQGEDIDRRLRLGLVSEEDARREREQRALARETLTAVLRRRGRPAATVEEAYESSILELAGSPARLLLVNLEDMWGETEPQNLPGTGAEQPNWRRRARYGVSQLESVPGLSERLARVDETRRAAG